MRAWMLVRIATLLAFPVLTLGGCAVAHLPAEPYENATLTPATGITRDLFSLPRPKGKVVVAVYGFRDQTGQYKSAPDSSFSTSVTQGATSMLIKALKDSNWFIPVERENLQNLLTERKIIRALETTPAPDAPQVQIPTLTSASVLIEGGVVAYESNVRSGGIGAKFLGIGLSSLYRVDQVTINLRSVDIRNGQILQSVSTTKTIYSYELRPSVFRFVNVKDLVEFEAGVTRNEPSQLCVNEAIESGVIHLIVSGIQSGTWSLDNDKQLASPVVQRYLQERDTYYGRALAGATSEDAGTIVKSALGKTGKTTQGEK